MEDFVRHDPPKKKELKALASHVHAQTDAWIAELPAGLPFVGVGGTIRNLARVWQRRQGYAVDMLHGYRFPTTGLRQVLDDLLAMDVAARRKVTGLSRDRADIIVAGGVVIREIVERAGAPEVIISSHGLREGVFLRYLFPEAEDHLPDDVRIFSAQNLMRQYYDFEEHNVHVQTLALSLFDQLQSLHGYGEGERELLAAAALVHDIGMAIDYYDHHKHGLYLVMSRPMPGFSHREQAVIALLVRYHRKGSPTAGGLSGVLGPGDMERVSRLGGLLRLAEYLERSKSRRVRDVICHLGQGYVQVVAQSSGDTRIEIRQANDRSDLLAAALGVTVEVVAGASNI